MFHRYGFDFSHGLMLSSESAIGRAIMFGAIFLLIIRVISRFKRTRDNSGLVLVRSRRPVGTVHDSDG
jgi:hypothetical protein